MNEKQFYVSQPVYSGSASDLPEDLTDCIAWLRQELEAVPEAFRTTAKIEIVSEQRYGAPGTDLLISYLRPETEEEKAKRIKEQKLLTKAKEEREIMQYKALQLKYGKSVL